MNDYNYIITSDGELYHYGVKGMRWGKRNTHVTASDKKWAKAKHQPSSARSSALAGLYAATGSERIGKALDKSNERDAKRWAEAKQKVAASKKNIKRGEDYFRTHDDRMKTMKAPEISLDRKKVINDLLFPAEKYKNDNFSEKPNSGKKRPNI